jgi:hypothetical protein
MKFLAEDDQLVITLEGWEAIWSLRRRLVIPKSAIQAIQWTPQLSYPGRLWRIGGTGLPGVLYAGNWRGNGMWHFLYLARPHGWGWSPSGTITAENVLTITTRDFAYQQILLTCEPAIGQQLVRWGSTSIPIPPSDVVPE